MSQIENDRLTPSAGRLERLAAFLNVTVPQLQEGVKEAPRIVLNLYSRYNWEHD